MQMSNKHTIYRSETEMQQKCLNIQMKCVAKNKVVHRSFAT